MEVLIVHFIFPYITLQSSCHEGHVMPWLGDKAIKKMGWFCNWQDITRSILQRLVLTVCYLLMTLMKDTEPRCEMKMEVISSSAPTEDNRGQISISQTMKRQTLLSAFVFK